MSKQHKITYGNIDFKSKSADMTSYQMDKVMCPYDGEIVKTQNSNCADGYLVIKHNIDGDIYYTQYCGIKNVLTPLGAKVKGGETLGFFSDNPITFSVLTHNLEYFDPKKFLSQLSTTEKVEPSKDKTFTKSKDIGNDRLTDNEYDINALSPISLPIEYAYKQISKGTKKVGKELKNIGKGMFQLRDKERDEKLRNKKEESNENLNEEITRIKNLLK